MGEGLTLNAFEVLGLTGHVSREQLKKAYHSRAKLYHPDLCADPAEQDEAQRRMVELNLAYEQALLLVDKQPASFHKLPLEQVKATARRLIDQKYYESALMQLSRAEEKDAEWFALQGEVLLGFKEYETAHQSFREAVRREPEDMRYRSLALDAALLVKRNKRLPQRVIRSLSGLMRGTKRR